MIVKTGTKRVTLVRFILAKLLYDESGISIEEFLLLYHLFFDLVESRDPVFLSKYGPFLERVGTLLENEKFSRSKAFPLIPENRGKEEIESFLKNFIPNRREYFGLKGQRLLSSSYRLVFNDTLLPKRLPLKRYIGVGYSDKGTRRDLAVDGSPSWQSVGSYFSELQGACEDLDIDPDLVKDLST